MSDLSNVKPGDVVAVGRHGSFHAYTVERVTDTQIVLEGGSRYRRKDGRLVGGDWMSSIASAAPHLIVQARRASLANALSRSIPLTAAGIAKARALLDRAEAFIKEHGE